MLENYIKIAIRNLIKQKTFSIINIAGLSLGIACFLYIAIFVKHEFDYEKFHKNADNIYRVNLRYDIGVNKFDESLGPVPLAEALVADFPEVLHSTRLYHTNYRGWIVHLKKDEKFIREEKFVFADSTVFDVFTIPLLEGDISTALDAPNSVVIRAEIAQKYFGDENPIGKLFETENGVLYKVTGITKGMPAESHFEFDFLASFSTLEKSRDPEWYDTAVYTYVVLSEGYNWQKLDEKLPQFSRKYCEPVIQGVMGIPYDEFLAGGNYFGFFMEPLLDIHLYSDVPDAFNKKGEINTVLIFMIIGVIILVIASINFVNLSTARSLQRAKEVGIRKVVGSSKKLIISQFLLESIVQTFLALLISIVLLTYLMPILNGIIQRELDFTIVATFYAIPMIIVFVVCLGVLSGLYPAFVLSRMLPTKIFKSEIFEKSSSGKLRNSLVTFQFAATIILLTGTIVVYTQLHFIQNKKLGYDKDQVLVINNAHHLGSRQKDFKDRLSQVSSIYNASFSDCLPEILLETKIFEKAGSVNNEQHTLITMMGDVDFNETFGLELIEGRYFDEKFASDSMAVVLNEAAVKALEIENINEETLYLIAREKIPLQIVGVLKDFHLESLHNKIRPFAALVKRQRPSVYLSVRFDTENTAETIKQLETLWNEFLPGSRFEYIFFDDKFEQIYRAEMQAGKVVVLFSILAILIACLGLIGLVSYSVIKRGKEIAVRKVMGSSILGITIILLKEYLKLVVIASCVSIPIAYYFLDKWLENFAFRIDLDVWIFAVSSSATIIVSMFSVVFLAAKAGLANPVIALKDE